MSANLDPRPWLHPLGHRLPEDGDGKTMPFCLFKPRPEFDAGNNPILQAVALEPTEDWLTWIAEPDSDDGSYILNGRYESFTCKQIEHARNVLEAIARESQ